MSGRPIFLWDNTAFDDATLVATSEKSGWPVENLQTTLRKQAWKTDGTGSATVQVDFGEDRTVSALGLVSFNLLPTASVTVRAFSDAFATEVMSEEWDVYESILGWGEGRWNLFGWNGYPTAEDLELMPRITKAVVLSTQTTARYWEVEFDNGSTEFYLGRLFLCRHWEGPPLGDEINLSLVDPSEVEKSLGGQRWANVKDQYYRAELDLRRMTESELFYEFVQISKLCGVRKDMIVRVLGYTGKQTNFTTFYGRFEAAPTAIGGRRYYGTTFVIEEST